MHQLLKHKLLAITALLMLGGFITLMTPAPLATAQLPDEDRPRTTSRPSGKNYCGDKNNEKTRVETSIAIGCAGKGNPITDATFAIIRFLTTGVGIVMIGSIIYGGIQYSASRGDPQATAQAINRIQTTLIALVIFIFGYAFLNYIIPAGFLK